MLRSTLSWLAAALAAGLVGAAASAQPLGTTFTYQGELRSSGAPVATGVDLQFKLFDAEAAGNQIGSTLTALALAPSEGRFTVDLDFGAGAFGSSARFLEVAVRSPAGSGLYVTLSPRQRISAAPASQFSLEAATAVSATSAVSALNAQNSAQLNGQAAAFYQNASNLTSGTIPNVLLSGTYSGALSFSNAGNAFTGSGLSLTSLNASNISTGTLDVSRLPLPLALFGENSSAILRGSNQSEAGMSCGVLGTSAAASGMTYGGLFENSSTGGIGVYGTAHAPTGATFGVYGQSTSPYGTGVAGLASAATGATYGVYGWATSPAGTGVYGYAAADTGTNYGGYFLSRSTDGRGLYAHAVATSGGTYGVFGEAGSTTGTGVIGVAGSATGTTYGVVGQSASTSGTGVRGLVTATTGVTSAVYGENPSTDGRGVRGWATAGSGATYGVYGQSSSPAGTGVYGYASATSGSNYGGYFQTDSPTGRGLFSLVNATSGQNYGVWGQSNSTGGGGVCGVETAFTGTTYGGYFQSASSLGRGALGLAISTTGETYGLYGQSYSTGGRGVYGSANASTGSTIGVLGESDSTNGRGVQGYASASSGTTYGLFGYANVATAGYAVFSSGNFAASGTKAFRIDDPADPQNKYLLHYSAESPDVINFYSGKVRLDGSGGAVVWLPAYFARINTDPRYTLTAIGAPMPMLHIAEEVDEAALSTGARAAPGDAAPECFFRIAGGNPGGRVSWRVDAVRNDRWVQKHGAPVEVKKQGAEKGTYQHPDLYGQPEQKGINWPPSPQAQNEEFKP